MDRTRVIDRLTSNISVSEAGYLHVAQLAGNPQQVSNQPKAFTIG